MCRASFLIITCDCFVLIIENMKKLFTLVSAAMLCMQTFAATPVEQWGRLKLVGNQLSSEKGEPIQLRGWSTTGSWQIDCYNDKSDFEKMKNEGANMARIAMYVNEGKGYDIEWVKNCVDYTAELGIYCLVDWHILKPGDPNDGVYGRYNEFFSQMTSYVKQKGYKHVLWEICNEPNINEEGDPYRPDVWVKVKDYAEKILPVISQNDKGAVVIVGTPQWDKALSCPMENPISAEAQKDLNVMYTFHHYTCDQQMFLGILSASTGSIPVFVTEWGASTDDGGTISKDVCLEDADRLMAVCNGKNVGGQIVSWANWSWQQKDEASATFTPGGYDNMSFSKSGNYIRSQLKKGDNFSKSTSSPYEGGHKFDGKNDLIINMEKYDKGGLNEAYYDFCNESWCGGGLTNKGDLGETGFRDGEYVDLGYTDKSDKEGCLKNIGYIQNGEWVKYTIEVERAGDYEFETYVCDHIDRNVVAISVDGKNALFGENGEEKYKAFRLQAAKNGVKDGGYDEWAWKPAALIPTIDNPFYSDFVDSDDIDESKLTTENYNFHIRFEEPGTHVLGVSFLTSNSGLGGIKLKGKSVDDVDDVTSNAPVIAPNPADGGVFNVSVFENSTIKVVNSLGAVVYSGNADANSTATINLNAAPGIYFVSVVGDTNAITEKLIVK